MRKILIIGFLICLMPAAAFAADMTTSVSTRPDAYWWTGNPQKDTGLKWAREVEARLEADTSYGWTGIFFTKTDTPPTATEGMIYYDDSEHCFKYRSDSNWVAITTGTGDNTLDAAYDQGGDGVGAAIDVDSNTITFTVGQGDNIVAFLVAQNDSNNDPTAMQITSAANAVNAIALDIDAQTSGRDIEGTGVSWYVTGAGAATFLSVSTTTLAVGSNFSLTGVLELASGDYISNTTASEIRFIGAASSEDFVFDMDAGTNAVGLKSSTDVDELMFGPVDDLTGVGTIVFDAEPASITLTGDHAGDDLTIHQDGIVNASLILFSAGTAGDALTISTDAGGMDITVAGAAGGEDLDILSNTSITLTSTEATADAIKLNASDGAGGIDIDFGTGDMIIVGNGGGADFTLDCDGISIDATGASNISFANAGSEDVTIAITGSADHSLIISATGTGTDALQISTSAGGMDITVAGSSPDDDLDITSDSSINIEATEAAATAIVIDASNAAGGIDIDFGTGDMAITGNSAGADFSLDCDLLSIDATGASNISFTNAGAEDVTFATVGAADHSFIITASGNGTDAMQISTSAGGMDITVAGSSADDDLDISADSSINIVSSEAIADAVTIEASAGGVDITTAASFDIDLTATLGAVNIVATEASAIQFSVDAQGTQAGNAIVLSTSDGAIYIDADGAVWGDIELNAVDDITLTAGDDLILAVSGEFNHGGVVSIATLRPVNDIATTPVTVTSAMSGTVFVSHFAGVQIYNLPDAAAGLYYTFTDNEVTGGYDTEINPQAGDNIDGDTNGDSLLCDQDTIGHTITLLAIDSERWITVSKTGTWDAQSE